jgi:hypothetical protein
MRIAVSNTGTIEFVHSDTAAKMFATLGDATTRRASHVEPWTGLSDIARNAYLTAHPNASAPDPQHWFADLSPVGGHTAGPFTTKADALTYEVHWIERNALCLPKHARAPIPVSSSLSGLMSYVSYYTSLCIGLVSRLRSVARR